MKGAKDELVFLILALQVVVALRTYDVALPPNVDEFSIKIEEIVDGKVANPEFLIQIFKPDFSYAGAMGLANGALEGTILDTWGLIITVVVVIILFILSLTIGYCFLKSKRE